MNAQIVCDASLKITNLVAKWPGSTHDSFILTNSALGQQFSESQISDGWLLGKLYIYTVLFFFWHINHKLILHITLIIIFSLMFSMFLVSSFKSEHAT